MFRANAVFASDERTRGNGRPNSVFMYFTDATTNEQVVTFFQQIEGIVNAKLVSVNRQIGSFGYDALPEGLPGKLVKVLFKNETTGAVEQVSYVFGSPAADEADVRAALTPAVGMPALQNRYGNDLGGIIRVTFSDLSEE
jgi:hypothetical protein